MRNKRHFQRRFVAVNLLAIKEDQIVKSSCSLVEINLSSIFLLDVSKKKYHQESVCQI